MQGFGPFGAVLLWLDGCMAITHSRSSTYLLQICVDGQRHAVVIAAELTMAFIDV